MNTLGEARRGDYNGEAQDLPEGHGDHGGGCDQEIERVPHRARQEGNRPLADDRNVH